MKTQPKILSENKATRFKENKHYSSEVASLRQQIEQLKNSIKSSPKDDMEILNYQRKNKNIKIKYENPLKMCASDCPLLKH